ncbi:MAG: helix-turn-helix transcriptional regulator [Firmicutes bacterium]|nr:helix-turn-helix transcriptional regulator [Bacillota bacterium]
MLADKLRALREEYNITQKQVADLLNIDRSTYSYYETGKSCPTLDTLVRLARIFGTSTDELLDVKSTFQEPSSTVSVGPSVVVLSFNEKNLVLKYRQLPAPLKQSVDEFLDDQLSQSHKE